MKARLSANTLCSIALAAGLLAGSHDARSQWVSTGGPLGGLGYDVRIHPVTKTTMYVTDNFAGVVKSTDAGATWTATNSGITVKGGPSGDAYTIFSLTVDPNNPDIVWAGTQGEGGRFGIFKSTDAGATWSIRASGITAGDFGIVFRGFTVQPGDSNVVYAMAELPTATNGREFNRTQGRVYKTADGGSSWSMLWQGDNLARYLIIDPRDSRTLYLSTGIFDREANNSTCADGMTASQAGGVGILKSTDGGATWTAINNGLADLYVGSLRMHPTNYDILFAATGNNACSGQYEGLARSGLFRSTNGGATWSLVIPFQIMTTVNFAPSNPNIVYAGSSNAFYRSSDGGNTWSRYGKSTGDWGPQGVRAGFPIDVVIDPADPNLVYANNYGGGVFRSTDGTQTWQIWSKGYSGAFIKQVFIPPASPSTVLAIGRSGPYTSANYGGDWTGIALSQASEWVAITGHPSNHRVVLMTDEHMGLIVRSEDGGATGSVVFTHPQSNAASITSRQGFKGLVFAPSNGNIVYAGVAKERGTIDTTVPLGTVLYKSTDAGRTFAAASTDLNGKNVHKLVVHPTDANTVWAATSGGLYKSTNGGTTWTLLGLSGKNVIAVAVNTATNTLVASEQDVGVWLSENGGTSWSGPKNTGLTNANPRIMAFAFDPSAARTVYAGDYYSGVYRSTDNGTTWSPYPDSSMTGLTFRAVRDLAIGNGILYAGTEGGGVFRYGSLPTATSASITGNASGPLTARALSFTIQPAQADLGANRQIFVVAALTNGSIYLLGPSGWQGWTGGSLPVYASGALAAQTVQLFDGTLDLSVLAGTQFYVGYGTDGSEMVASGRFALIHTLQ